MYHIPETCQQNSVCQNEKLGLSNTENSLVGFQADRVIYSLKVSFLWTSTSISSESREFKLFYRNSCTFSHFEKRHCTCDASSVDKKVSVNHSHFLCGRVLTDPSWKREIKPLTMTEFQSENLSTKFISRRYRLVEFS